MRSTVLNRQERPSYYDESGAKTAPLLFLNGYGLADVQHAVALVDERTFEVRHELS